MNNNNNEILEAAAELIVTLHSWGMHQNGPLLSRDADTGMLVGGWAGEELEKLILKYRSDAL
jgi:hypothetical protein